MKVYEVGGAPDWVCANSKEEADKVYREFLSDKVSQQEIEEEIKNNPPIELSESDMDSFNYTGEDESYNSTRRTFREELATRTKPEIFANYEY